MTTIFVDTLLFDHGTPKQVLSISFIEISFWAHWDFHTVSVSCLLVNSSSNEIFRGTSYNQYSGGFHLHLFWFTLLSTKSTLKWLIYRMCTIISHGLYIYYPLFEDHFFVLKKQFVIKSGLWWCVYGSWGNILESCCSV